MGLFSRNKEPKSRPLLFPGDIKPDMNQPDAWKKNFAYTSERRTQEGIASEDVSSYMDAGYATVLGLSEDEEFLAWGPVWVSRFDDDNQYEGTAVITPRGLLTWWQPSRRGLIHTFQAEHDDFIEMEIMGNTAGHFRWDTGKYANDAGKFIVGDPVMYIAARFSDKDGHANRRALSFYWTLADCLGA